jgi:hypothetical protein
MAKATNSPTITVNPMFKLLLWINATLCVVTLGVMIWAGSMEKPMPKARERLFNACEHVFTLTAGGFHRVVGRKGGVSRFQEINTSGFMACLNDGCFFKIRRE